MNLSPSFSLFKSSDFPLPPLLVVFVSCPWEEDCVALSSPSLPSLFCASWAFPRLTPWLPAAGRPGWAARVPGAFGSSSRGVERAASVLRKRPALAPASHFSFLVSIAGSRASWPLLPREGHTCQAWSPRRPGGPGRAFSLQTRQGLAAPRC